MISNLQPDEKKEHVRLDINWVKFIRRIMQLGDGIHADYHEKRRDS